MQFAAASLRMTKSGHVPHNFAEKFSCQSATMSAIQDHAVTSAHSTQAHPGSLWLSCGHAWYGPTSMSASQTQS